MIVLEVATLANFFESGYLLANLDVADATRSGSTNPKKHFAEFGQHEFRRQVTPEYLNRRIDSAQRKFARFSSAIDASHRSAPALCFLERPEAFPVSLSDAHLRSSSYSAESANDGYGPFIDEIRTNQAKTYMDLGCGLRNEVFENCLYVDAYPSLTADVVVAPDCTYPFADDWFDGIGCFAVLEHVTEPWTVASEIHRMLKPKGQCFISWPFLQPVHGYPSHYFNATRQGLELVFSKGFEINSSRTEPWEGPNSTISWILGKFVRSLPAEKRERVLAMSVADLVGKPAEAPFWNDLLADIPDSIVSEFACGNSLIATKR